MILEALLDRIAERSNGVFIFDYDRLTEVPCRPDTGAAPNYEIIAELYSSGLCATGSATNLEFILHNGYMTRYKMFQADFTNPAFDPESFCDHVAKGLAAMIDR
jgi:hypothetical protein